MRHRIWLLALVVSMGLACGKDDKASDTSSASKKVSPARPVANATVTPTSNYTVKVTFEGLVGYVNSTTPGGQKVVWALLPKADPECHPPLDADASDANEFPQHFAALKVPGKNVQGSNIPGDLQIPIEGSEIMLKGVPDGSGINLLTSDFHQDSVDAAVDQLAPGILASKPPNLLAARMMLPSNGLITAKQSSSVSTFLFQKVYPVQNGKICDNNTVSSEPSGTRVESVTWTSPSLSTFVTLTLHPFSGMDSSIVLGPASGENAVEIKVVNQIAGVFVDPNLKDAHWPAYRWFYNLSKSAPNCYQHYYPNGSSGGNRCPQKLFTE